MAKHFELLHLQLEIGLLQTKRLCSSVQLQMTALYYNVWVYQHKTESSYTSYSTKDH